MESARSVTNTVSQVSERTTAYDNRLMMPPSMAQTRNIQWLDERSGEPIAMNTPRSHTVGPCCVPLRRLDKYAKAGLCPTRPNVAQRRDTPPGA